MTIYKRTELDTLFEDMRPHRPKQIYLCFGERYLCRQAADRIQEKLLNQISGAVHVIDGSIETASQILSRLLSFSLLPGLQIYRVEDSQLFLSRDIGVEIWVKARQAYQSDKRMAAARHLQTLLNSASISSQGNRVFSDISSDQWQKLFGFPLPEEDLSWADSVINAVGAAPPASADGMEDRMISAIEQGFPADNVLLLTTEHVDKRKRLFTHFNKHGMIIDCSVTHGTSRAAVKEQKSVIREMALKTLAEFKKTIEPRALELLFERVGFHPVAIVMEMEKLALFTENASKITLSDLDLMVSRTREEALFELTDYFGKGDRTNTLITLNNLIQDGVHNLAILATLRNYLRKMMVFRSLQNTSPPEWSKKMSAHEFQNSYLPALKETAVWPKMLIGHPYALYMSFNKAAAFSIKSLKRSLTVLLEAEFRLKGAPLPQRIVLEELMISLISMTKSTTS